MIDNGLRWRIALTIVLLLLLLGGVAYILFPDNFASFNATNNRIEKATSYSSPTIRGRVESINGSVITLIVLSENTEMSSAKRYNVNTTSQTILDRSPVVINYLVKPQSTVHPVKASIDDLFPGMNIEADLIDTNNDRSLVAEKVTLPRIPYVLDATITNINGDTLEVDGVAVLEMSPAINSKDYKPQEHKKYSVKITRDTEISKQDTDSIKVSGIADLDSGQKIIVYSETDVIKNTHIEAARVEPIL